MANQSKIRSLRVPKVVRNAEVLTRKQLRALRDFERRELAFSKAKFLAKQVPKDQRELNVKLARRALAQQGAYLTLADDDTDADFQSGIAVGLAASGAAVYTARQISKLCSSLTEVAKETGESTEAVLSSVKEVLAQAGGVAENADEAVKRADGLTGKVSNLVDQISSAFTSFTDTLKATSPFMWMIPACVFLYAVHKSVGNNFLTCAVLGLIGAAFFPALWGFVSKWFRPDVQAVPETGSKVDVGFLSTLVCLVAVPKRDPTSMAAEIMRRASMAERSTSGFQHIFDGCVKIAEKLVNVVLNLLGKEEVQWTDQVDRMLRSWSVKVDAFEKVCTEGNPTIDQLKDASLTQQEGLGLRQVVRTHYARLYLDKYLDRLEARLQPHRGALNNADAFRQMPIFVLLGGGSGVGKTSLLKALAAVSMLLAGEVKASEAIQHMWQKGTTEYYNGYIQQKVLVLDDCFQLKTNGTGSDVEAMTIIRFMGNFACPLNYADVESKGRFYFNSPLVIGTTNVDNVKDQVSNVVACPEAVTRRIRYGGWIFVAEEYQTGAKGELDYEKVSAEHIRRLKALKPGCTNEDVANCIPWEAWKWVPHEFIGAKPEKPTGSEYSLRELVQDLAAELKKRKALHHREVETYTEWLQKLEDVLPQSGLSEDFMPSFAKEPEVKKVMFVESGEVSEPRSGRVAKLTSHELGYHDLNNARQGLKPGPYRVGCLVAGSDCDNPEGLDFGASEFSAPDFPFPEAPSVYTTRLRMRECKVLDECPGAVMDRAEFEKQVKLRGAWLRDCASWLHRALSKIPEFLFGSMGLVSGYDLDNSETRERSMIVDTFVSFGTIAIAMTALKFLFRIAKGLASAIWGIVSHFFGSSQTESNIKMEPAKKKVVVHIDGLPRFAEQQLGNPPEDIMADKFYNNTFKMMVIHPDGPEHYGSVGQILFVDGDIAVMPDHFNSELEEALASDEWGDSIVLHSCLSERFDVTIPIKKFLEFKKVWIKNVDICYVKFDWATLKTNASIAHLFLNEAQLCQAVRTRDVPVRLDIARYYCKSSNANMYGGMHTKIVRTVMNCPTIEMASGIPIKANDGQTMRLNSLLKYDAPTVAGDCGAPLTIAEPRYWGGKAILGIHVAGRSGLLSRQGFSSIITQENVIWARKLLNGYEDRFQSDLESRGVRVTCSPDEFDTVHHSGLVNGSMTYIGAVDKPLHMAGKSKIKRSGFYGAFEKEVGPCPHDVAVMRSKVVDGVRVEPMVKAMEAYQSPLEYRPMDDIGAIVELATKPHWKATKDSCRDILSFKDALCGREGMKLKPVARNTSPGYPYRLDGDPGKSGILGTGEEYDLETEKCVALKARVEYVIECAKANIRLSHIYSDFLKDELRPLAKVASVATRAISGAPLDYVVAVRMYFGAFLAAMFTHHTESGMAPGINHYTEWHFLAEKLSKFGGDRVFGGDFSRFDASEQPYIHMEILKYMNRWYKFNNDSWCESDDQVRSILWLDLIHSRHLTGLGGELKHIVQWNKSLPSGHPLTTPVNSLYSLITLTACYVRSSQPRDYTDMWEKVYLCTFGDDNVAGVSEAVSEVFNQVTVAEKMDELFGLSYTSDKKGQALVPFEDIRTVTFLKRTFVPECIGDSTWTAPLLRDSYLFVPYWFKNMRAAKEDLEVNLKHCLSEMCLHRPEVWEQFYPIVDKFCAETGCDLPFLTRDAARTWVASRTEVWY